MNPNLKAKLDNQYYSRSRNWPSFFDIKNGAKILDIGCGRGVLGGYLQEKYFSKVTGVDIVSGNIPIASAVLHKAVLGDVELMDLSLLGGDFDYIIFSDSLEHLLEPQVTLEAIKHLLASNGSVLIAIPNIRNYRVIFPLLFNDQWEYQDEGLLDRTHFRFFTQSSICNLLHRCGYQIEALYLDLPLSSKVGALNICTFGVFRKILTAHYFLKACLRKS